LTVELTTTGKFELHTNDAELLVQVSGDFMWQKERLLNIALLELPEDVDIIAWFDCDIVLQREDWADVVVRALQSNPLVQLFSKAYWLDSESNLMEGKDNLGIGRSSVGYRQAMRMLSPELRSRWREEQDDSLPLADGYAWAARADIPMQHRFYDACIIGGGTRDFSLAALGDIESLISCRPRTEDQLAHLLPWASEFSAAVAGRIGYVDGAAFHLWHGDSKRRLYGIRHQHFRRFNFSPFDDIKLSASRTWLWSSEKPEMHQWVKSYFDFREGGD